MATSTTSAETKPDQFTDLEVKQLDVIERASERFFAEPLHGTGRMMGSFSAPVDLDRPAGVWTGPQDPPRSFRYDDEGWIR